MYAVDGLDAQATRRFLQLPTARLRMSQCRVREHDRLAFGWVIRPARFGQRRLCQSPLDSRQHFARRLARKCHREYRFGLIDRGKQTQIALDEQSRLA